MLDGRIAVIGIGTNSVLNQVKSITNSLNIPYIAIEWSDSNKLASAYDTGSIDNNPASSLSNQVNIHPPAHQLIRSVIDLVMHYKWEFITILYAESLGPERVKDLIKLPYSNVWRKNKKMRLQIRQLSINESNWIYQLKEIKLSGSSHIIIDIEKQHFHRFIKIVRKNYL